jgi:predicted dehydrogenase
MDDQYVLVAGAISSERKRALASAADLGLAADRSYGSYKEMAEKEAKRADGIEAVSIVTPNNTHAPIATAFLNAGIHVICDKPLSLTAAEARDLVKLTRKTGKIFAVTHNYTAYPMIRQARAMIAAGELGDLRIVQAEYAQDWLTEPLEKTGQKQAKWRTDPKQSGAGALGDIGTHAYNLTRFITGLLPDTVSAQLKIFEPGRALDDYGVARISCSGPFCSDDEWSSSCSCQSVGNISGVHLANARLRTKCSVSGLRSRSAAAASSTGGGVHLVARASKNASRKLSLPCSA